MPFFSIITVCFNAASTIERTIQSVIKQTEKDFEYIIIDGLSSDGTEAIVKKYPDQITYLREVDHGIYDAMNKGLELAKGKYIHFLNADDYYGDENVLQKIKPKLTEDAVYFGKINFIENDQITKTIGEEFNFEKELSGSYVPQPATFYHRSVFDKVGNFDLKYKIVADYEIILRIAKAKYPVNFLPVSVTNMSAGGVSDVSARKTFIEWKIVAREYGLHPLKLCLLFVKKNFLLWLKRWKN